MNPPLRLAGSKTTSRTPSSPGRYSRFSNSGTVHPQAVLMSRMMSVPLPMFLSGNLPMYVPASVIARYS
jgi:hypothetical protein